MQYFIRNTSMVVTQIEGSGSGARVYVVGFFFSAVSEVCLFVFILEVIDMGGGGVFLIIPGDGAKDPEQHPHGLPTHRAPQHHGPRHRLLQALLLRGHHHRQPHCHAGAHYYVSFPIYTDQYNANPGKQVHQRVDVFAKDVLREDGRCLAPFHPSYPFSRGLLRKKTHL